MGDALGMRRFQRIGDLLGQAHRCHRLDGLLAYIVAKCLALQQLHHQERPTVRLAHVVDCADVRMTQRGGCARLALETLPGAAVGNRFR